VANVKDFFESGGKMTGAKIFPFAWKKEPRHSGLRDAQKLPAAPHGLYIYHPPKFAQSRFICAKMTHESSDIFYRKNLGKDRI